jgi:excisionase family DNA binding protein
MPAPSTNKSIEPRLLRISEAAKYLGATPWFVRSLIWARSIPHCKFGKRLLIDRSDLDLFIAAEKEATR